MLPTSVGLPGAPVSTTACSTLGSSVSPAMCTIGTSGCPQHPVERTNQMSHSAGVNLRIDISRLMQPFCHLQCQHGCSFIAVLISAARAIHTRLTCTSTVQITMRVPVSTFLICTGKAWHRLYLPFLKSLQ